VTPPAAALAATPLSGEPVVGPDLIREHNLNDLEYERIVAMLGRDPTVTELGIFSALWSEHCSYKHSKTALKTLPTTGSRVLQGPGENAGVLALPESNPTIILPLSNPTRAPRRALAESCVTCSLWARGPSRY
jgi:phosphoribosylformylglycinamidine synthase